MVKPCFVFWVAYQYSDSEVRKQSKTSSENMHHDLHALLSFYIKMLSFILLSSSHLSSLLCKQESFLFLPCSYSTLIFAQIYPKPCNSNPTKSLLLFLILANIPYPFYRS
ncbi:hypothetical protein GOODEAATRI_025930 [Goodea atripinnis]|uniref:Uncharacterized protein n=1 Tax=Goodea atripinnis TaxID=208336 RepID=A0ABV0Q136_9TELE